MINNNEMFFTISIKIRRFHIFLSTRNSVFIRSVFRINFNIFVRIAHETGKSMNEGLYDIMIISN